MNENNNEAEVRLSKFMTDWNKQYTDKIDYARANKPKVIAALTKLGATKAVFTYDGSGDSSSYETVEILKGEEKLDFENTLVEDYQETTSYFQNGEWKTEVKTSDKPLKEAMIDLGYDLVSGNFPGWENNEGAYGDVEFKITENELELTHNTRRTEVDTDTITV